MTTATGFDGGWEGVAAGVLSGVEEWRLAHPQATLVEIEKAVDEQLNALRVWMLADTALVDAVSDLNVIESARRPSLPDV